MFQAGTRLSVCCSSIAGQKLGPKRHSLGFASHSDMAYIIKNLPDFPIKNVQIAIFPLQIIFTRYGREQRERQESRSFLHILPVFYDEPQNVNVGRIMEVIRVFKGKELIQNPLWADLAQNYGNGRAIGVAIPVGGMSPDRLTDNDAKAWVESLLREPMFRHLLTKNRLLPTLTNITDTDITGWLNNATKGGSPRRDLFRWASDDPNNMKRLLRTVRTLSIIFEKRASISNQKNAHPGGDTNDFMTWLTRNMLTNVRESDFKQALARKVSSSTLRRLATNNKLVRDTYLNLKPKYI